MGDGPQEFTGSVLDLLDQYDQLVGSTTGRHPRVRTGAREPISPLVRLLVWWRDVGTCAVCKRPTHYGVRPTRSAPRLDQRLNLDHILPWSAGGADDATNLRVTCEGCNQDRSNYREVGEVRPRRPVTPCCDRCLEIHAGDVEEDPEEDQDVLDDWFRRHDLLAGRTRFGADLEACPVCAGRTREAPDVEVVAYCGMCSALSLVTDRRRVL